MFNGIIYQQGIVSKFSKFNTGTKIFIKSKLKLDKKDTEDSQFFILLQDTPTFNGRYTPVGKVLYGIEVLKKIKKNT